MSDDKKSKWGIPARLMSYRKYCVDEGYELLPEDYRFIDLILNDFTQTDFKPILTQYLEEWHLGMAEVESPNLKQGQGRRRANKWLFEVSEQRKQELNKIEDRTRPWDTCFD